jgi:glycosyltransferase involved in cell wall biosynthesis
MESKEKIKVFYYGDGPCVHTGFGVVAKNILNGLYDTGKYDITCLGINYHGEPHNQNHLKVYATQKDPRGRDIILEKLEASDADVLFTINDYDALTFVPEILANYRQKTGKKIKWVSYMPVDGRPVYPEFVEMVKRYIDYPVLYTQYALESFQMTDKQFEVPYVYHGVDRKTFYKIKKELRDKLRTEANIDDKFVVLAAGVNQIRKQFNLVIQSFAAFAQDKPNALLYLHTQPYMPYGWDLIRLINLYGIRDKVVFTKGLSGPLGIEFDDMRTMYSIADVFLHLACGEGFGLNIVEAAACGVPILYHDATAPSEFMKGYGYPIPTDHHYIFPFHDRSLIRPIPNVGKTVETLNLFYENRSLVKDYQKKSLALAAKEDFNWENAIKLFDELLVKSVEPVSEEDLEMDEIL